MCFTQAVSKSSKYLLEIESSGKFVTNVWQAVSIRSKRLLLLLNTWVNVLNIYSSSKSFTILSKHVLLLPVLEDKHVEWVNHLLDLLKKWVKAVNFYYNFNSWGNLLPMGDKLYQFVVNVYCFYCFNSKSSK